jgi:hypothetical protein
MAKYENANKQNWKYVYQQLSTSVPLGAQKSSRITVNTYTSRLLINVFHLRVLLTCSKGVLNKLKGIALIFGRIFRYIQFSEVLICVRITPRL